MSQRDRPSKRPAPRRRPSGVTLIELLTTTVIAGLLVVGLASSLFVATKSLETAASTTNRAIETGEALDRLNAELRLATQFSERTATAATFTIPDRTGDGYPETIRYAWGGAGTPLTRTFNGLPSPAAVLLDNVQAFNMNFLTRTVPPPIQESGEQLLISYVPSPATTSTAIYKTMWGAQYFKPALAANVIAWKITRIQLLVQQGTLTADVTFRVTNVDAAQKPAGAVLDSYTVSSNQFPTASLGWFNVPFTALAGLNPAIGYSFQVTTSPGNTNTVARVGFSSAVTPALTDSSNCYSTDQGATWSTPVATKAIFYQVYGTVTTQGL